MNSRIGQKEICPPRSSGRLNTTRNSKDDESRPRKSTTVSGKQNGQAKGFSLGSNRIEYRTEYNDGGDGDLDLGVVDGDGDDLVRQ